MSAGYIWTVIAGMAVANFLLRFPPMAVLSRISLPEWLRRWLSYVPVSVMVTLVVGEVARPNGQWMLSAANPYLWASFFTGIIYWRFRSFLGATLAGVISFLALKATLG
ncbi:MAG: AzlD domain-containing protein [Coriobacteriia bacterium]|nr:AzlD domain-containing protein [Coriobacteriia bacterium]